VYNTFPIPIPYICSDIFCHVCVKIALPVSVLTFSTPADMYLRFPYLHLQSLRQVCAIGCISNRPHNNINILDKSEQLADYLRTCEFSTHRRRRRGSTVELSRVGGVLTSQLVHSGFGQKFDNSRAVAGKPREAVYISIFKASGELHTEDIAIDRETSHFRRPHSHLTPPHQRTATNIGISLISP